MEQPLAARRRRFLPRGCGGIGLLARAVLVLGQPWLLQAAAAEETLAGRTAAMWMASAPPRAAVHSSSWRLRGCFLWGLRPPLGPIPLPRASSAFCAKAQKRTAQESAATPLPDDPAHLKLLVQLREAEGRAKDLELRMNARELAAIEEKLETAESRLRERDARVAVLEREKARLDERERARFNERVPLVEYVAYRAMIKGLEYAKSPLRRREGPKAPRVAVWEEIFADDGFFLASVLEKVDFGKEAEGRTAKEMIPKVAEKMDNLYRGLYSDVHLNCVDPPYVKLWGLVDRHMALFLVIATQFSMMYEELNRYDFEDALSPEVEWLLRPTEEDVFGEVDAKGGAEEKASPRDDEDDDESEK